MRKVVVSFLVGFALAFSVSVHAEEIKSFIGATIEGQFPVTVNGETIEDPGIIVSGTSYLPTRTIAELAGYEVAFDADLGISLEGNESLENTTQEVTRPVQVEQTEPEVDPEYRIKWIEDEIKRLELMKRPAMSTINYAISEEAVKEAQAILADIEAQIADLEVEKAALEAQLQASQ